MSDATIRVATYVQSSSLSIMATCCLLHEKEQRERDRCTLAMLRYAVAMHSARPGLPSKHATHAVAPLSANSGCSASARMTSASRAAQCQHHPLAHVNKCVTSHCAVRTHLARCSAARQHGTAGRPSGAGHCAQSVACPSCTLLRATRAAQPMLAACLHAAVQLSRLELRGPDNSLGDVGVLADALAQAATLRKLSLSAARGLVALPLSHHRCG
jgi:hypothetical protein